MFHAAAWHMWYMYGLSYNKNTDVHSQFLYREPETEIFSVKHDWTDIVCLQLHDEFPLYGSHSWPAVS